MNPADPAAAPLIHPTALIHPGARLGAGVRVGPYAVIEGPAEIGEGCVIQAHAVVTGWVRMGAHNTIGYGAIVGADPQDYAFNPATESWVVLGAHNRIREYSTLHRGTGEGTQTRVGDHCFLMTGAHVGHNAQVADRVVIANNVLLAGHVHIGTGVFLGGGSVFHQFVHVGRQAIIQGNAAISKNVPPFVIAAKLNGIVGINVVGLRRSGMDAAQRQEVKDAFKLLYKSGLNTAQALAASRERAWSEAGRDFFDFVAGSKKRGICDFLNLRAGMGRAEEAE
ncbi:MAG: acyl-ACP--UDP-N-acetylglucosamine O-acyltransferase [Verrucomicrobiota bacterium]